jgi:hypothetical protein
LAGVYATPGSQHTGPIAAELIPAGQRCGIVWR